MAGAGVFEGDVVAIKRNHAPEHGDLVAARIDDAVELRRFRSAGDGSVLAPEPGRRTTGTTPRRVRADADNVTMIGVEIASTTTARSRKRREREMVRARKDAERGLGIE